MCNEYFHDYGVPVGISLARPGANRSYAIRVRTEQGNTMFSVGTGDFPSVYARAVEERLHVLGKDNDEELRRKMLDAFDSFCAHYKIIIHTRIIRVFGGIAQDS